MSLNDPNNYVSTSSKKYNERNDSLAAHLAVNFKWLGFDKRWL